MIRSTFTTRNVNDSVYVSNLTLHLTPSPKHLANADAAWLCSLRKKGEGWGWARVASYTITGILWNRIPLPPHSCCTHCLTSFAKETGLCQFQQSLCSPACARVLLSFARRPRSLCACARVVVPHNFIPVRFLRPPPVPAPPSRLHPSIAASTTGRRILRRHLCNCDRDVIIRDKAELIQSFRGYSGKSDPMVSRSFSRVQ